MTSTSKDVLYPLPAEVLSIAANFCYSCGKELNEKADEPKSEMSDDSSAVSANDYRNVPSRLPLRCYSSFIGWCTIYQVTGDVTSYYVLHI